MGRSLTRQEAEDARLVLYEVAVEECDWPTGCEGVSAWNREHGYDNCRHVRARNLIDKLDKSIGPMSHPYPWRRP